MIDHILVSPNIDKHIANAYIYHGYSEFCGKWNSDHYPVVIDFIHL
jgi:exonuclease III